MMFDNLVNENLTVKKIRILYSDPEATDSSSDEEQSSPEKKKPKGKKIQEIVIEPRKIAPLQPNIEGDHIVAKKKFVGVRRRASGNYAAEIRDPLKKKRIWIGTFKTAEEAHDAYLAKQREFQARKEGADQVGSPDDQSPSSSSSSSSSSVVPGTEVLGSPDRTQMMKVKVETLEFHGGCVMGVFVPAPKSPEENCGSEFFLPIVDNHGFLVGEFSKLDDLSICLD